MPKLKKETLVQANTLFKDTYQTGVQNFLKENKDLKALPFEYASSHFTYFKGTQEEAPQALAAFIASLKIASFPLSEKEEVIYNELLTTLKDTYGINEQQINAAKGILGRTNGNIEATIVEIDEDGSIFTLQQQKEKEKEEAEKNKLSPEEEKKLKSELLKKRAEERIKKEEEEERIQKEKEDAEKEKALQEEIKENNEITKEAIEKANKPYEDYINNRERNYLEHFNDHPTNNVLFNASFFNRITAGRTKDLVRDPKPNEHEQAVYQRVAHWRQEDNAAVKDSRNNGPTRQAEYASRRLESYFGLRDKLESKSFLDILKHPWNTFMEYVTMQGIKNDIKKAYNVNDAFLDKTYDMIMGGEGNRKNMPSNFGGIEKDGTIIKTKAPQSEIDAKFREIKAERNQQKLQAKSQDLRENLEKGEKNKEKDMLIDTSKKIDEASIGSKEKNSLKVE